MICVLIYSSSLASQRDSSPAQVVAARCPLVYADRFRPGTRYLVSFPSLLRHREGNIRLRPAARRASAFSDSSPKASVGPLPQKAALGTWEQPSLTSVPAECPE